MGSMSASDAAPLPRLGEVFFDVRGNSRSMRLSWYADTGVAVFSIWQGGTCTGTFRLPIDDLDRMVEALRRGPQGQRARRDGAYGQLPGEQAYVRDLGSGRGTGPSASPGEVPDPGPSTVAMRPPSAADYDDEYPGEPGYHDEPGGYPGGYPDEAGGYPGEPGGYQGEPPQRGYAGDPGAGDYRDRPAGDYQGGYSDEPATGDYRTVAAPGYRDDPLTGDYRGAAGYRDDSANYVGEPLPRGYAGDPAADYRGGTPGDYRDNGADGYRDDSADYPAEPLPPAYPGDPPFRDYPHEPVIGDYQGEPAEHDLEPGPGAGGYERPGREWEDTDVGPLGGYSEDPSPESFPYGRPPGKRRSRERGRYPGRH
jgi:hypothetical protein